MTNLAEIKRFRRRRKAIKKILRQLEDGKITLHSSDQPKRHAAAVRLLELASGHAPMDPLLVKAALELTLYQDVVAKAYLHLTLEKIKANIARLKRESR